MGVLLGLSSAVMGIPLKWPVLGVITIVTFAIVLSLNRRHWGRPAFWAIIIGLCALHCAGYISLLMRVDRWPGLFWGLVLAGEVIGINVLVASLLTTPGRE